MRFRPAKAKSKSPALPASEYYIWRVPDKPVSVGLPLDIVDRLGAEVMDAFWAVPKRGAEIGGLLLGKRIPGGMVLIEDYELVPCEHRRGPSYQLSERDRAQLAKAIARRGLDADRRVVGYFRSHTREGLRLEEEDDGSVIRQYFADPADVVLLVKPFASRASVAGFFIWENGTIRLESSYLEFSFSRTELAKTGQLSRETVEQQAPDHDTGLARTDPPYLAATAPQPGPKTGVWPWLRATTGGRSFLLPALITALLLGLLEYGAIRWLSSSPAAVRQERTVSPLFVERSGEYLQITWNRKAPAVAGARRAVLRITDGTYRKEVRLDVEQLRSGSMAYLPLTGDVNFRLDIEGNHATVTEYLRVVIPPREEAVRAEPLLSPLDVPADRASAPVQADAVAQKASTQKASAQKASAQRASAQRAPVKRPAKKRPSLKRRFFDDGL